MTSLVSVVVPFFNQEGYLAEAIESVLAQTMPDWELLLVDDGSHDQSPNIAAAYAAVHPKRIRLLRHPSCGNHGAAAARNVGIAEASGEYLCFLDGDDVYEPHKLEAEISLLQTMPEVAMLYAPTIWWYPGGERRDKVERLGLEPGRIYYPPVLAAKILLLHKGDVPCICSALIRREALTIVGGFEESFRLYEDQTLWGKLFFRYPVFVSHRPSSRYRQHADSTSARAQRSGEYHPWRTHAAEKKYIDWLWSYSESLGVTDPEIVRAFRKASSPYGNSVAAAYRFARYLTFTLKAGARQRLRDFIQWSSSP
jgi:glycosyltransferase involved in cell wall biosynthesis